MPLAETGVANEHRGMFDLHPRLEDDTFLLGDWPLCRLLLMNDARFPWLILVPRVEQISEISQLSSDQRTQLMDEIMAAEHVLRATGHVDKINIGALGNIVSQLHIHVIARQHDDAAWPTPVWGHGAAMPYTGKQRESIMHTLRQATDHIIW